MIKIGRESTDLSQFKRAGLGGRQGGDWQRGKKDDTCQ